VILGGSGPKLPWKRFASQLIARIRQFDFGAEDVDVMVVSWPVDFLPS
jgi:hypothetical protein